MWHWLGCGIIGHVVWHIRNFALLFFCFCEFFLLFLLLAYHVTFFCHHRILILFGFNVVKGWLACQQFLIWVGYCSSNFGTFGSDNSTNLDYLRLLLGDVLTFKIHYPGVIHCNPLYRPFLCFFTCVTVMRYCKYISCFFWCFCIFLDFFLLYLWGGKILHIFTLCSGDMQGCESVIWFLR